MVGNRIEDYAHIGALVAAVKGGTRKLFSSLSREDLFNQVGFCFTSAQISHLNKILNKTIFLLIPSHYVCA